MSNNILIMCLAVPNRLLRAGRRPEESIYQQAEAGHGARFGAAGGKPRSNNALVRARAFACLHINNTRCDSNPISSWPHVASASMLDRTRSHLRTQYQDVLRRRKNRAATVISGSGSVHSDKAV